MTPTRSAGSANGLGLTVLTALAVVSGDASAQFTVYDPAVTARNTVTAIVQESVLRTQQERHSCHSQLRRMAQRLRCSRIGDGLQSVVGQLRPDSPLRR